MNDLKGNDEGRNDLMLIIKATKEANYNNLADLLDEVLMICGTRQLQTPLMKKPVIQ